MAGISGFIGAGAQDALSEVLERRLKELVRQQQEQQHADRIALERQQQASIDADRAEGRNLQRQTLDLANLRRMDEQTQAATDRNVGLDAANVLNMPGMTPQAKAGELQQSVLRNPNASSAPGMLKVIEGLTRVPEKKYTSPQRMADGSIQQFEEGQIPAGSKFYQEPKTAPKPEKPSYIQVTGPDGTMMPMTAEEIRAKGGVATTKGNAPDPQKAREVLEKIVDAGTKLKDSPGLKSLTGNRLLNPDYNLGWSDEPRPGSKAATSKAQYDTLKSVMTLENLSLLKGAMSDKDLLFLQAAGSSLNTAMDDPSFAKELDNIIERAKAKLGQSVPSAAPAAAPLDGVTLRFNPATGKLEPVKQ